MTVGKLKELLAMMSDDATVHVTEGESTGISIRDPDRDDREVAFFYTKPVRW